MVDFAVITCPRELPTLNTSIRSLRSVGFEGNIKIFAEPGEINLNAYHIQLVQHAKRKGAFKNYDYALSWLLRYGHNRLICVMEDDYIYNDNLMPLIKGVTSKGGFGYYNLFTNRLQPGLGELEKGWNETRLGWNSWGVGYIFERSLLPSIMAHEVYQRTMNERNKNIDAAVSEACIQLGLPMYVHNPSACYSIGYLSTLGHKTINDGFGL
jgi:hypothetical protein